MKILSGNSNRPLAEAIAAYIDLPLTKASVRRFSDMEVFVEIEENVRGEDVFVIQSTSYPANDNLMELLVALDALRRGSARRITAVIPYFGYARQDRKSGPRTPISAKLVANLITEAGADRVLTLDLHAAQIQGFFDIPADNLYAEPVFSRYFREQDFGELVLVSPDVGNTKRARAYAERLGGELAIIDKRRVSADDIEVGYLIGEVKGKTVLMMDDMITTAGTIVRAATLCMDRGAKAVYVGATHGVLCGPAAERLREAPISEVTVTDTVPISKEKAQAIGKLKVLSVAELMGEAIHRIHHDESVSSLFLMESNRK